MREKKITLNKTGNGFIARLIERPYGGTTWILCEEFDVTSAVLEIIQSRIAPPTPAELPLLGDDLAGDG